MFELTQGFSLTFFGFSNVAVLGICEFIDFDGRTSHLYDAEFVTFLDEFHQVYGGVFGWTYSPPNRPFREVVANLSFNTTFLSANSCHTPMIALIENIDPYFYNFIPLATNDGRLIINPEMTMRGHGGASGSTWAKLAIPASANGELAWEFIQYLIPSMINHTSGGPGSHGFITFGHDSLVTPITRRDFVPHITSVLENAIVLSRGSNIVPMIGVTDGGNRMQAIDDAIIRLSELNEMPVAILEAANIPASIVGDTFFPFVQGITSVEATAQEIHNRISLWLIE